MAKFENDDNIDYTDLAEYRDGESSMAELVRYTLKMQGPYGLIDLLAGPDGADSTTICEVRECAEFLVEEYPCNVAEMRRLAIPPLEEFRKTSYQDGGVVYEYEYGMWYFAIEEEDANSWGWEASTPVGGWHNLFSGELHSPEDAYFEMTVWAGDNAYIEIDVD